MPLGMPSRGSLGNPLARQSLITTTTSVHPQDLYSGKKVRLVKVGAQTTVSSTTGELSQYGAPIPMGFGRFAISRASTTIAVVDYNSAGIVQVRSNAAATGRSTENQFFRGIDGNGYWYVPSSRVLNRVSANGASSTSNSAIATVSTLAASGTITNGGAAYSALVLGTNPSSVNKYGDNLVVAGTATVAGTTKMVVVFVSLSTATVTAVYDLGAANISNSDTRAITVYKDILTLFQSDLNTATNTTVLTTVQLNIPAGQVTTLTSATWLLSGAAGRSFALLPYSTNGAVWLDLFVLSPTPITVLCYGFATSSSGVAVNHVATVTNNSETVNNSTSSYSPTLNEYRTGSGTVRDFDYNLTYGFSNSREDTSRTTLLHSVLLQDDYRFAQVARARAPIAFLESNRRLPVSMSLVCAGSGDQTASVGSLSGYDALLTYLDDGYWVLMSTDGDGGVPTYNGYLQLYREA